jgi:nucleoside-diphosphate-sugar epimerase
MKALVTGANGFLGRHVVGALLARGIEVRAMVRPAASLEALGWPSSVEVFRADLRTSRELRRAFAGVDVLLHLAAVVSGGEDAQFAGTVVGTERLLDAMAASACRRLLLCSSFSVYDYSSVRRTLDEDSPLHQAPDVYTRDGYTIAKWWQERVTRLHLGPRSRLLGSPGPAVRAAPPGHRSADPDADDACGELRRRLCVGDSGCARSRPDLERG